MAQSVMEQYAKKVTAGLHINPAAGVIPHLGLGLTGEAGEVADLIKKSQYFGGALDFARLEEELGDVLWYLQALTTLCGLTIEDLAIKNILKLSDRRPDHYRPIDL